MAEVKLTACKEVSCDDLATAVDRWTDVAPHQTYETLNHFLDADITVSYNVRLDRWIMPVEAARKIDLLNGPNYIAIIKAWFVQQEKS